MYAPNNIKFRIVSSSAIAQFKMDQSFDFNELANCDVYSFSGQSREILLLYYDLWFKYILLLEKIFIRRDVKTSLTEVELNHFAALMDDVAVSIEDVISANPDLFNTLMVRVISKTNKDFLVYINEIMMSCKDMDIYYAFPKIVSAISNVLHNLLLNLHECDFLCSENFADDGFLCYTRETSYEMMINRARIYSDVYGVTSFDIKNYTIDKIDDLKEVFSENGFIIDEIWELQNSQSNQ